MNFVCKKNSKWFNRKKVLVSILFFSVTLLGGVFFLFPFPTKWLKEDLNVYPEMANFAMAAAVLLIGLLFFLLLKEHLLTGKLSEELRLQKDYLQSTLNSIKEGLIATDKTGKIVYMNPAAESLTGWRKEEAANKPFQNIYEVYHEETRKPIEGIASRLLKEGKEIAFDNNSVLKVKEGGMLNISNYASPILDEKGNLSGVVLVFNDKTKQKNEENKLKSSEPQLRDLIQNLPEAIYSCDNAGYIQMYNKAAVKLWGREPKIGKDLWNGPGRAFGIDGSALSIEECPMAIALKEKRPVTGKELLIQRDDGSFRHVLPSPVPIFNSAGELTGAVNMIIDITDKKKKESLILTTEELYGNLFEQATDAIIIYSMDGTIHEFNNIITNISGYTREEFAKLNLKDILVGDIIINPEKLKEIMTGEYVTLYRQIRRKDGKLLDMESKVKLQQDGRILAFSRDITERKKTEDELRLFKENYLTLINSIDGIVWEADANTFEFSFVSDKAERLLGYPKELWTSQPTFWADHIHEEDRAWAVNYCKQCTTDKIAHEFEYRMIAADGSIVWLRDIVSVRVENDVPVKLIGIMVNITNKKISENEIKEKNIQLQLLSGHLQKIREEERASMAREIHDELGQQLTIMKMDISWLLANMKQEGAVTIKRAKELSNIIDQTVTTVRRIAYELRPSLLDDMGLGAAIEWQLIEFEKRSGIKTKFQNLENELALSDAAKTGLFRIVQESLTNTGRYSNAKKVVVSLAINKNHILMSIKDDGIGFELEKLAYKKTLGIVGMRERCIILGGVLEIISSVGAGTEVKVTMPIHKEDHSGI
jgi:PAS domain S-box-containing protein